MKYKKYVIALCGLLSVFLWSACSKSGSVPDNKGGGNTKTTPTPSDLSVSAQVSGVSAAAPYGDSSGVVNITLSGKNVTSYSIAIPSLSQSFTITGSSGTLSDTIPFITNSSSPFAGSTVNPYIIAITAYNGSVSKDTTISVTVACKQRMVWSDEFDSTALNTKIWNYETGNLGVNNEQEYYTSDLANVSVKDGKLQITALHSPNYNNSGWNYTSARINTQNKYSFKYGRVDILAKIPGDEGTWPALWLLGNDIGSVSWPACGEIDMMEEGTVTGFENILSSLHWGQDVSQKKNVSGATTSFHLYSMDWRADHIAFYYDSTLLYSQPNSSALPFNQNFFLIFNVAVGGDMGGNTINLGSGSTMYVDYVRVYN